MSLVNRIIGGATAAGAGPGVPDTLSWRDVYTGARSMVGKQVTPETALGIPALWGGMRILTDTIGSMPLITYQRVAGGSGNERQEAFSDPSYRLLRHKPNPEMTGTHLWRQVIFHLNSYGNSYLSKIFTGSQLTELWPIKPDRVRVQRRAGVKEFYVADTFWNWKGPYFADQILHIQGISFDGIVGISPIEAAREAIGLGLALDEYTNRFFSNGAIPRVALTMKGALENPQAADRIRADWERKHGGLKNSNTTAVLEEGMDVKVLSFPMKDLQFVEQMQWTAADIARILRIPASKLNVSAGNQSMTYKTSETEQLDLLACVQGWTVLIEEALSADADIYPNVSGRQGLFCEYKADALLRVDAKTRAEYLALATGGRPWLRGNDARVSEGYPSDPTINELPPGGQPVPGGA